MVRSLSLSCLSHMHGNSSSPARLVVFCTMQLDPCVGPLIITPSTFEPGDTCEFELQLYVLKGAADAVQFTALPIPTLESMEREGIPIYEEEEAEAEAEPAPAEPEAPDAGTPEPKPEPQVPVVVEPLPSTVPTEEPSPSAVLAASDAAPPAVPPREDATTPAPPVPTYPPPPTPPRDLSTPPPPPPAAAAGTKPATTKAAASNSTTATAAASDGEVSIGVFGGVKLRRVDRATLERPKPRTNPTLPFNFERIVARRLAMQDSDEEDNDTDTNDDDDDW